MSAVTTSRSDAAPALASSPLNMPLLDPSQPGQRVVVVGGGVSGLTTAWRLRRARPDLEVVVLERGASPGGTAATTTLDGYTVDWGPSTFAATAARLLALSDDLGLRDALRPVSSAARSRYVFSGGALRRAPSTPSQWLRSPLMPLRQRLRPLLEPLSPSPPGGEDESVFAFASRRFGEGVASALVEPLMLGITAGDARRLSLRAMAPSLHAMDSDHRSVVWALLRRRMQQRRGEARAGVARLKPTLWGFEGGVATLISALAAALGDDLQLGAQVTSINPGGARRWRVRGADPLGAPFEEEADAVVLASPAHASAHLLRGLDPDLSDALSQIPYTSVRVTALGYRACDVPTPLDGFGFLVRPGEAVRSLGCLWSSSLFPGGAPRGHVLLRLIAGGVNDLAAVDLSDTAALAMTRADLARSLGINAAPVMVAQRRLRDAIPQYELGHCARLATIAARLHAHRGLLLCSNAYHGVSLEDCISQAERAVSAVSSVC
jgi:oxygen-dependent protoporphyrinogen oxidase